MTGSPLPAVGRQRSRPPRGRKWGLLGCGAALAAPIVLTVARLTGLDAGTVLAVPMALFPSAAVFSGLVLGVLLVVPALRSRWMIAATAALVVVQAVLLAPRWVPDGGRVPEHAVELRVATVNTDVGRVDPRAVVELVRSERIDILAVEQTPSAGLIALDKAGLGRLLPHHELHPEYDSSIYAKTPLRHGRPPAADTAWPQTTAEVTAGGRTVRLVAVHTYYPLGDARRWTRDMTALASVARRSGPDTVFLGDFNASLDHAPMRTLLAAGVTDTHAELGHGWARTWPAGHALVPPLVQLDHVLHGSGLAGVRADERSLPGTDHRAVVATLALLPARGRAAR